MTCLALIIGFTAIFFTAKDVIAIQVAEILCGIPWGVFQTRESCCGELGLMLIS
jgi:SP family general alpha glucoside:H+ symporter-like MFS transporter